MTPEHTRPPVEPHPTEIVLPLLQWMDVSRRDLPWRRRRDPYSVWVSEIMLQQTRAEVAASYFKRWMFRFPDIASLAAADLQEVLKAWEGLGYYARARNLHRTAKQLVSEGDGCLPADIRRLTALPGIGRSTAGAILSLAFGVPEPVLDGNVRRVLCRLHDLAADVNRPSTQRLLWQRASELIAAAPEGQAGCLNEALIELGALVCRPRKPDCCACPLVRSCLASFHGSQADRPSGKKRRALPLFPAVTGVIQDSAGRLLIVQRNLDALLGGLWGLPGAIIDDEGELTHALKQAIAVQVGVRVSVSEALLSFKHSYTHFSIKLSAYRCELLEGHPRPIGCAQVRWVGVDELDRYPFPASDLRIIRQLSQPASQGVRQEGR